MDVKNLEHSGVTTTGGENNTITQGRLSSTLGSGGTNGTGEYLKVGELGVGGYADYKRNTNTGGDILHITAPHFYTEEEVIPGGGSPCSSSCVDIGKTAPGFLFGNCCAPDDSQKPAGGQLSLFSRPWTWQKDGKLKLSCKQPLIPVPVIQEIQRRDKIIEVPNVDVVDAILPKVYNQGVKHDVPKMAVKVKDKTVEIPRITYIEKEVVVPVVTGYTHKFVPKWEIRQVPRPIVKYVGEQQIIEVEVPQIKFVDKVVEREVIVDKVEKKVPKIIEIPKYVETIKYVWKPVEKIVPLERFVPKFDVTLECPAPLIVPFPVQRVKEMKSVLMRKSLKGIEVKELGLETVSGVIRVPKEYIKEYTKRPPKKCECASSRCGLSLCDCSQSPTANSETTAADPSGVL